MVDTLPITVVIPCYKQHKWIDRAIESAQAAGAAEVRVFLDSGFNDLDGFTRASTVWLSYSSPVRSGVCYARNNLITSARHDFIFPLDADDRLYPDSLQRLYDAWRPGTWVYGGYTEIAEDETPIETYTAPPPGMLRQKNITYSSFLFHKDDWQKVGGYDPDFEFADEDYAFTCALTHHGIKPVRLEGEPIYQRMIHPDSGRTHKARQFWSFAQQICKERWPNAFL